MERLWAQTKREKVGTIDGINLFFGALLGTNLGSLDGLGLKQYAWLVAILCGTVVAIRLVATSERRWYALSGLAAYCALLASMLLRPSQRPEGVPLEDLQRLIVTLAIWIGAALLFEFWPTRESKEA